MIIIKKIGIPLRLDKDLKTLYINKPYLEVLNSFNIDYELIDNIDESLDLRRFDGFIIPGGYDINPEYYKAFNEETNGVIAYNDTMDFSLLDYASQNNIPVLGICRGLQSINVFFKGSLTNLENHENNIHSIITKNNEYMVNSYHHQGIKKLGKGLITFAKHNDLIEGIIHERLPIIGVQWHPELDIQNPFNKKIFIYYFSLLNSYSKDRLFLHW